MVDMAQSRRFGHRADYFQPATINGHHLTSLFGSVRGDRIAAVLLRCTYCFSAGAFASGVGAGASGSGVGVAPRSSGAATQSPAQILVPLTDPNSLQPIGADGLTCFNRFPPTLGAAV